MATALVTGVAGFIGSHLAARLLREGWQVRGIDNFDPYYDRRLKEGNLLGLRECEGFTFQADDLNTVDLAPLLTGVTHVFHLAARAGVRRSWGADFAAYVAANITATQRLLEALRAHGIEKLVWASSSSVYGEGAAQAVSEDAPRRPISPYGVTKLAGEGLVQAYHRCFGIPVVALRYFTVYGPGQRPDMAFHRFLRAALAGRAIEIYGDGHQTRGFTFIDDIVTANLQAAARGRAGAVYNIGGGAPASLRAVLGLLEGLVGHPLEVSYGPVKPGDPRATDADISRAREDLGYQPAIGLEAGLQAMTAWMKTLLAGERDVGGQV